MEILQQRFDIPPSSKGQTPLTARSTCEVFAFRQAQLSEFILDVAWLLKKPTSEQHLTSIHIQRFNNLLSFLIENKSCAILERVLYCLKYYMDNNLVAGIFDSEMRLLRKSIDISQKLLDEDVLLVPAEGGNFDRQRSHDDTRSVVPATHEVRNDFCRYILL